MGFEIDPDYVEVSERVRDLFAKHPDASLRGTYEVVSLASGDRIIYRAECFRTPDDPSPGVGTAWEDVPGKTPYTKGSELQNAETSAWGRAIVAVGASESKRIASADEIRSSQARQNAPRPAPAARIDKIKGEVLEVEIQGWVKDQDFEWPWTPQACDQIEAKISNERKLINAGAAAAPLADPKYVCPDCGTAGGGHTSECPRPVLRCARG